jgi:hypothetical protein
VAREGRGTRREEGLGRKRSSLTIGKNAMQGVDEEK